MDMKIDAVKWLVCLSVRWPVRWNLFLV